MRTNDIVVVSFTRDVLEQAGIPVLVADEHMSVMEGAIGAFPRRILVSDEDAVDARRLLEEAGVGEWLVRP